MASQDLQKNLPHILALGILIFALLIIATKTGLVGCSSLGQGYCDVYYSVLGKPTVLIIRGDEGMGSPDTLARMIETQYQLPVQKLRVEQVSRGNIEDYSLIIVEHAREIPTEKLKVFYDYLFEDMGRLVWVGDAGTIGSSTDQTCRTMEYTVEWRDESGKRIEEYDEDVCVKEGDVDTPPEATASEAFAIKRDALMDKALGHMEALCADAFDGELDAAGSKGRPCKGGSYQDVYFEWDNEAAFRGTVNPWARGEYEKITTEGAHPGIDFSRTVLGVGFVADDFAVAEFDAYHDSIDTVKENLASAHAGFVTCSNSLGTTGCSQATATAKVDAALSALEAEKSGAKTDLSGITTTLNSLAQQKDAKDEDSSGVKAASTRIDGYIDDIEAVVIPDGVPSNMEISAIEEIADIVGDAREDLVQLRGSETDTTVKGNYDSHISTLESREAAVEAKAGTLRTEVQAYGACEGEDSSGVAAAISAETGYASQLDTLIAYSSPLIDENGAVDFIKATRGGEWQFLADGLKAIQIDCGGEEFTAGMASAAAAIEAAQDAELDPATESEALATMQVADIKHPLVEGVTRAKDLKKDDLPVPFVLVEANDVDSHEVVQLRVTPAYHGVNNWPGISVKDPKFASHIFGRGVVVYYAFPPETDEVFVKNLVEFMLY